MIPQTAAPPLGPAGLLRLVDAAKRENRPQAQKSQILSPVVHSMEYFFSKTA